MNHCQRSVFSVRLKNGVYWKWQKPPSVLPSTPLLVRFPPSFSQLGSTMPLASIPVKPPTGAALQRSSGTTTAGLPILDQPPKGLSS